VPLRTLVGHTLVISTTGAIHLLTPAIFFVPAETDDRNHGTAAETLGRVPWTWNPHARFAATIRQNGVAPRDERCSRQDVQSSLSALLGIESIVGLPDNMRLDLRWM